MSILTVLNKNNEALMVIDIDDFKTVNDSFGHLEGNEVLVAVSKY